MVQESIASTTKGKQAFIKQDPRLTVSRNIRNVCIWMIGTWVILPITVIFIEKNFHFDIFSYSHIINASPAGMICLLMSQIYNIDRYKKMEQQRQAVAQGNIQVLADQQPSQAYIYSFPSMFSYKYSNIALFFSGFVAVFVILFITITFLPGSSLPLTLYAISAITITSLTVFSIQKSRYKHAELIADEYGLTLKSMPTNKVQYITWHEARLFAIDNFIGEEKQKLQSPRFFELSSKQEVIRWPGTNKKASSGTLNIQTLLSEEEYTRQLENLHAFIVEKTGLALNDLRKQA